MYNHILISIDESELSGKALDHAVRLAGALGGGVRLTALHVNPGVTLNEPTVATGIEEALKEEDKHVLAYANAKLAAAGAGHKVLLAEGDPAAVICRTAKEAGADLIVMGSRGVGLVSELLLGSVSHAVAKHAHCPVLLVK
ncbi:Nucleotide-binding universal stress protein, UspA family [Paenibacillus sp. UNC496MF]|uniref:universal stress protein n=1 Tax=Paenibacillus sp. UNC496MF TaxID=1502753 RepID=UPI0008E794A0|nr:universal stress protein [Paenibacillus sp. UNC496MF]SFJ22152.1 Nucleotide-binding universal stress protein, UspA family [Paenibacillus sp. UNC496MF]